MRLRDAIKTVWNNRSHLPSLARHALTLLLLNIETRRQFSEHYGDYHRNRDLRRFRLMNPGGEGGAIIGDVVYFASTVDLGGEGATRGRP